MLTPLIKANTMFYDAREISPEAAALAALIYHDAMARLAGVRVSDPSYRVGQAAYAAVDSIDPRFADHYICNSPNDPYYRETVPVSWWTWLAMAIDVDAGKRDLLPAFDWTTKP